MALAGKDLALTVSADDATYSTLGGANSFEFTEGKILLGDTKFLDQAESFFAGLKNGGCNLTVDYLASDAGRTVLDNGYANGTAVWFKALYNGTAGQKCKCMVEDRKTSGTPEGKVVRTYALKAIAAATDV